MRTEEKMDIESFIKNCKKKQVKCNICGSSKYHVVGKRANGGFKVVNVACKNCGLIYQKDMISDKDYKFFYENLYENNKGIKYFMKDNFFERLFISSKQQERLGIHIIDFLKLNGIDISNKKVLDVGCGTGKTLSPFLKYGCSAVGIDYNKNLIDSSLKGVKLVVGGVERIRGKYDFIILSNIIEHFIDPKKSLKIILRHLNSYGYVYITQTGLYTCKYYGYDLDKLFFIEHPYTFNLRTLTNLLDIVGLKVIFSSEGIEILAVKREYVNDYSSVMKYAEYCKSRKFKEIIHSFYYFADVLYLFYDKIRNKLKGN